MSSSRKADLRLDWCSYDAARYAVKRWHYSKSLPSSKTARIGVWENGNFIGAIVFAWGANLRLAGEYGLKMTECAELCRVALAKHQTPVSRVVSIAARMLKQAMPGIRLLVSYADPEHRHVGKIYQAMGWVYVGQSKGPGGIMLNGKLRHRRTINSKYRTSAIPWLQEHVDPCARRVPSKPKHKYLCPLDDEVRERIEKLRKPYPKKRAASDTVDTSGVHPEKRGSIPTAALHFTAMLD